MSVSVPDEQLLVWWDRLSERREKKGEAKVIKLINMLISVPVA